MRLRNKVGKERTVKKILKIEDKDNKYIVYEDINSLNIYGGKINKKNLEPLSEEEYDMLNKMMEKIMG